MVGRLGAALIALCELASVASADDVQIALADRWHEVPAGQHLRLSQQITDELTELGNFIGSHVNVLSDDLLGMKFDGRRRYARIRLGTGDGELLRFKVDTDWHFANGKARVHTRVDLGLGQHQFHLELPDMEMLPASYHGERGVEIRLPLFERSW
jgi:hypothetical protein